MSATHQIARGLRNSNPGNLRHSRAYEWKGELEPDPDGFCRFDTAHNGLRALCRDLQSKGKRGLNTVRKVIEVYAPPNENDTEAYIASVSKALDVKPDDVLDLSAVGTVALFAKAITRHECGSVPYEVSAILAAAKDALGVG